jgi:hypothetical protein
MTAARNLGRFSSTPSCSPPDTPSPPCWPGRPGADNIKPEPASATTDDEKHNDHDLRL